MAHYGFIFDQSKCIGCNACQMACKDAHDLEPGLFLRRAVTVESLDESGALCTVHYTGGCYHCEDAPCVVYCPSGAMHRQADGTVGVDARHCIGCGTCTWVCPYGAPKLSRRTGRSQKCDACIDRRQEGKEPVCAEACLTHCLRFADLDSIPEDEKKKYTNTLQFLPSPDRTHPNLLILAGGTRHEK